MKNILPTNMVAICIQFLISNSVRLSEHTFKKIYGDYSYFSDTVLLKFFSICYKKKYWNTCRSRIFSLLHIALYIEIACPFIPGEKILLTYKLSFWYLNITFSGFLLKYRFPRTYFSHFFKLHDCSFKLI